MKKLLSIILLTLPLPYLSMYGTSDKRLCVRTSDGALITLSATRIAALGPHNLLAELAEDPGYPDRPDDVGRVIDLVDINSVALTHLLYMSELSAFQSVLYFQSLDAQLQNDVWGAWLHLDAFRTA